MTQRIEALRATAQKWRAGNPEHTGGVVLVWEGEVYGWKDELRDQASERPGVYAVDKAGLVFQAEGGDDYNVAKNLGSPLTLIQHRKTACSLIART